MITAKRTTAALLGLFGLVMALALFSPASAWADNPYNPGGDEQTTADQLALDPQADNREVITEVYINTANIYGHAGDYVLFTATCPKDAPYNCGPVSNGFNSWHGYELWVDSNGADQSSMVSDSAYFEDGKTYYYSVYIWADDYTKYRFDKQRTKVFLNGRELELDRSLGSHSPYDTFTPTIDVEGETQAAMAAIAIAQAPAGPWTRLWGMNALETMLNIVAEGWQPGDTDTVVIATMSGYHDALAAAPLAGAYKAPILLTRKNELSNETVTAIDYLGATHAIIVGGPAAVSDDVEQALNAKLGDVNVDRVWGDNAQLTAIKIGEEAMRVSGNHDVPCIVATSKSYHDALSVAPVAYRAGWPIILTNNKGVLSQDSIAAINRNGYWGSLIVGGPAAVPKSTEDLLYNMGCSPKRLQGDTALETSEDISVFAMNYFADRPNAFRLNFTGVATMGGYHDALAGAALCGKYGSPLILVNKDPEKYFSVERFVWYYSDDIDHGYIFGGPAAVNDQFWFALNDL